MSNALSLEPNKKTQLATGTMVDFINGLKNKPDMTKYQVETPYSNLIITNNKNEVIVESKPNIKKLKTLQVTLGNIKRAGIEHGGIIYVFEDKKWSTYVDIDEDNLGKIDINRTLHIKLEKKSNYIRVTERSY